jgi:RNA polymerase sigma factor (TIGR02999 family)
LAHPLDSFTLNGVERLRTGSPARHSMLAEPAPRAYTVAPPHILAARGRSSSLERMPHPPAGDVTLLLQEWGGGNRDALDRLVPLLYGHLRELAHRRLRNEDALSIGTTALVHEAYIRLVDVHTARFRDRSHFLAMAARVMRRLLVDHARARTAMKRGAGATAVELTEDLLVTDEQAAAVTELDAALQRLAALDERQSLMLEQRYFGGLTLEETAAATGVSLATVKRELRFARAWLAAELGAEPVL